MSVDSSSGSPSLSFAVRSTRFSRNSSKMLACRNRREPAVQDWLCRVKRIALMMPSTAQSSFAFGNTMEGLLPPSSSDTGTTRRAACSMMSFPTSVEPVKDSLRTPGWAPSAAPQSSP